MPPRSTAYEVKDSNRMNPILSGECGYLTACAGEALADLSCLRLSQASVGGLFTFQLPPFGNLVGVIVGISAKEQVVRTHTRRIVTAMANIHAIRDRAVCSRQARRLRRRRSRCEITGSATKAVAVVVAQRNHPDRSALLAGTRYAGLAGINTLRHRTNLRCLTPRAVTSSAGASSCPNYTTPLEGRT